MKKIALLLTAFIVLSFAGIGFAQVKFSDIADSKYKTAIESLQALGAINGYDDGTYRPDQGVNRAEYVKIITATFSSVISAEKNCFPDVGEEWFAIFVCSAKKAGVVEGYPDGYFRPAQQVNYAEALKLLYKSNDDNGKTSSTGAWYAKYLDDAKENNIDINVAPDKMLSRGEVAGLVWNYYSIKVNPTAAPIDPVDPVDVIDPIDPVDPVDAVDPVSAGGDTGVDVEACAAATIPSDAIYVSTTGNDSTANGSSASPYRTVYTALQNATGGDTLVLKGGTYAETNELRISVPNITLRSAPGEWAIIDRTSETGEDMGVWFYVGSDGGKLECIEVQGGYYAFSTETMWDWGEADRSGASNITIKNTKLHDSRYDVVKIKPQSDNISIINSEIYNSGQSATPGDCNAEGIDNVNGDNMLVQNSYIHDTCSTGVYAKGGSTGSIIENNLIKDTGAAGIILGFDTSPEFFDLNSNPNYYENINGIARNNLIMNAGWAGIALYASKDAQVYNNTIIDTANIYHSPIYFGITFQDWDSAAGRPANINPSIHDNVVSQPSGAEAYMLLIRQSDELGGLSGLQGAATLSNNCYYQEGGAATFSDGRTQVELGVDWYEDWKGNIAEWQAHMSSETGTVEGDPQLDSDYVAQSAACAGRGYQK